METDAMTNDEIAQLFTDLELALATYARTFAVDTVDYDRCREIAADVYEAGQDFKLLGEDD